MSSISYETLTVRLNDGTTYYFPAGAVVGDSCPRVEMLRDAIENDSEFRSVDIDSVERAFPGNAVERYHLV